MKKRVMIAFLLCLILLLTSTGSVRAQEGAKGDVNWVDGFISAVGNGTSDKPSMAQKKLLARRAAITDAQRNLLEVIKGVKVDSQTTVENFMVTQDLIRTSVSGVVRGAFPVKESFETQSDGSIMATVEMRICLSPCRMSKTSLVQALQLDKKKEEPVPPPLPPAIQGSAPPADAPPPAAKVHAYDKTKPVTGIVLNLEGRMFERVILPVVVTAGEDKASFTVYSAKSVKPNVVRTYGVVRYADTVDQALRNDHLGKNIMVINVADITQDRMILINFGDARTIQETTRHGNDYLGDARVVIASN